MRAVLFCDGGSRGNPGPAAAAAVLLNEHGHPLASRSAFLGETTNNVAEYQSILIGLDLAHARGIRFLTVKMDSELVVRQISGEYRVKQPHLKPLWQSVKLALANFGSVEVVHIPREQNREADRLVNKTLDNL